MAPSRMLVLQDQSARSHIVRLMNSRQKGPQRMMTKVQQLYWRRVIGMNEDLSPTNVTIDRGNLTREVIRSWDKSRLNVDYLMHDNLVSYFKTLRRRSLSYGRAQTCGNQSNVWHSQRLLRVTLKFETEIFRSDIFAQVNLMSVAPTLRNLRIVHKKRQWQEQGAREAAWKLAKNVLKLKAHERATCFSPSDKRCLPASTLKPEEREFVVDSGASKHMISKKGLE